MLGADWGGPRKAFVLGFSLRGENDGFMCFQLSTNGSRYTGLNILICKALIFFTFVKYEARNY